MVGEEYTIMGQFAGYRNKVLLRHNNCSHEQEYYAHNFLYGQRCKYYCPRITSEYLRVILPQLSDGEYINGGSEQKNMVRVVNTRTKEEHTLRIDYALQELAWPTPSRVLPFEAALADYKSGRATSMEDAYIKLLNHHYSYWADIAGVGKTYRILPASQIPSIRQFRYYISKHLATEDRDALKPSKQEQRNHKRLLLSNNLNGVQGAWRPI